MLEFEYVDLNCCIPTWKTASYSRVFTGVQVPEVVSLGEIILKECNLCATGITKQNNNHCSETGFPYSSPDCCCLDKQVIPP